MPDKNNEEIKRNSEQKDKEEIIHNDFLSIFDARDKINGSSSKLSFKPLTGGLGFKDTVSSGVYTEEINEEQNDSSTHADAGTLEIGDGERDHGEVHINDDEDRLTLKTSEVLRPIFFHSGHDGLVRKKNKKTTESIFSNLIDLTLAFSGAVVILALSMDYLGFQSFQDVMNDSKQMLLNFFVLFGAFYICYKILTRLFFGRSLGEWACRIQMGNPKDQQKIYFPLQVMLREVFSIVTGVFVLPLLSMIFRRDLGYYISGVHMYIEHKIKK